ncbi:MAG TPA: FumA C-terminus/TtdB family hydratase beta subunit [Vicinamibacteria bacterium]|nr:FumA C-terminus/TtdB family hydratase beta subunit [Vicinamibacteria bacterium]
MERFRESLEKLIVETSTNLAPDVRAAIAAAVRVEAPGSRSALALRMIAMNVDKACTRCGPICQDTGLPTFYVRAPVGANTLAICSAIGDAVAIATKNGKLRPNSVDSLTGRNSGDNRGPGTPAVHFDTWVSDDVEVRLILKGGGCENVSAQYSLPCELAHLGRADRDLEGVRKCVLHALFQAQGQGCSLGVVGVAVGGDRESGHDAAKQQLLRTLDDTNEIPELALLEARILDEANRLGIGTMGFGGRVTLAGCKIGTLNRLPASYFVTIAYNCWALRRLGMLLDGRTGVIRRWLYTRESPVTRLAREAELPLTGSEVHLTTPLTEDQVRSLRVGDVVFLNGPLHTGRDALHHHLLDHEAPVDLRGAALYHCGPVAVKHDGRWTVNAAGPTTSIREEPYEADIIRKFGIRAVVGKGGMGPRTLEALKERGAVYLSAIGGAAQYYADCVVEVEGVDFLELGVPEAMWHLNVRDFPTIVTMDARGASLHADVEAASARELEKLATPGLVAR